MPEVGKPFRDMMALYAYAQDGESWIKVREPDALGIETPMRWDEGQRCWVLPNGDKAAEPEFPDSWCPCDQPLEPDVEMEVWVNAHILTDGKPFVACYMSKEDANTAMTARVLHSYCTIIKLPANVVRELKGTA